LNLDRIQFPTIQEEDNIQLSSKFEDEEIKAAMSQCEGTKSRGPDLTIFTSLRAIGKP